MPTENKKELPKSLPKMVRSFNAQIRAVEGSDGAQGLYEVTASSEYPVIRQDYWDTYSEVLDHSPAAVDMSRTDGMPLLLEHDRADQIGICENTSLTDGKIKTFFRFSRSAKAQEIEQDVKDGIRKNVSIGYMVNEYTITKTTDNEPDTYTATRWMPLEVSIVSIPADPTVGIGRSNSASDQFPVSIRAAGDTTDTQDSPDAPAPAVTVSVTVGAGTDAPDVPGADDTSEDATDPADATETPTTEGDPMPGAQTPDAAASTTNVTVSVDNSRAAADIVRLAQSHGCVERAADFLQRGLTIDQAAREILEAQRSKPISQPSAEQRGATMELNDKEAKQYSYARAILLAAGEVTGGFEAEVSQEMARNMPVGYKARGGVFVPMSLKARTLTSTGTNGAKETVFTQDGGELIDLLRNKALVAQFGARVLSGLTSPVAFPKLTGGMTAHWVTENSGSDVSASQLATGLVTLSPKTLQSTTAYSRQLLGLASYDIESMVRNEIAQAHALAVDRASLHGAGGAEPTGIYNLSGVNSVAMGGVPSYGKFVDMVTAVASDNALAGALGFMTTPGMAGKMAQTLVASAAGSDFIFTGKFEDGLIAGYQAAATNQVSSTLGTGSDEHGIVYGNWNDLLVGLWGATEIIVDPYALKKQGLIEVTSFQMADVQVRHAESFCKATGAKIA